MENKHTATKGSHAAHHTAAKHEVYIVDGTRTPFLKAKGKPGPLSASDLVINCGRELLAKEVAPTELGEVIIGCMMPSPDEANIARLIGLRLGAGKSTPAYTVQRNCASGMQALDSAFKDIQEGRHELVFAGGTEAMSRAPLLFNDSMVAWISNFSGSKSILGKLKTLTQFRPSDLKPVIALLRGLTDPTVNLSMGQTAENLAYRFGITREQMDAYALESHRRVAQAQDENHLQDVMPAFDYKGNYYIADDGVRRDSTMEKLAKLKPVFDKKFGSVTAGNSAQVTDGAAVLLLASKEAVKKYKLPVIAKIIDTAWAGVDPAEMGLGPVYSTVKLMKQQGLEKDDIDYWELNEAFAAQVLACLAAWESEDYCKTYLDLSKAFGTIDKERLNVDGGAIALGHPVGASGARIVLRLAYILQRQKAKRGVATICIGGGQGGAMLIENVSEVTK